MKTISSLKLNPIPRCACYFTWDAFRMGPRYMYAHQMLYVFSGTGTGRFGDATFRLEPGVFSIYGPGILHDFRSDRGIPMTTTTMCFSWCNVSEKKLSVRNKGCETMPSDYREYADTPIRIEGLPPFPFHLKLEELQRRNLEPLLKEVGLAWRHNPHTPGQFLKAKSVLLEVVLQLQKQFASENESAQPMALIRFRNFIENNYASDIARRDAADAAGISESHLTALLIRHFNSNFSEYLNQIRLKAAAELLQYNRLSVKETASAVGFRSSSYFVARFRERYGISPGHARNGV